MKFILKGLIVIILAVFLQNCDGDYRKKASGSFGEVIVVMDSSKFESETAEAIREVYGQPIKTLPNFEPMFDLKFQGFDNNEQLEQIKRNKNLIIASPLSDSSNTTEFIRALLDDEIEERVESEDSYAFPFQNQWYRNQWTIILTSNNDSVLAEKIRNSEGTLVDNLLEKEMDRWEEEIYERGEQTALADSIWQDHGWKIRIQHDWNKNIDTTHTENGDEFKFLTMRRPLPDNDRWFWAWWKDDVKDIQFLDDDWINAKRDSLMEDWIRGSREESYVTTEYRRPVETESFELKDGLIAYETLGTWQMTGDAMGGPFVNMTVYDEENDRLFMMEFAQFAPQYNKRRFVRQFRTMLRTFDTDSTWVPEESDESMADN